MRSQRVFNMLTLISCKYHKKEKQAISPFTTISKKQLHLNLLFTTYQLRQLIKIKKKNTCHLYRLFLKYLNFYDWILLQDKKTRASQFLQQKQLHKIQKQCFCEIIKQQYKYIIPQ
eukprot:EC097046.1.p2 GENE.EC097046.1~~EC097046.1.p2  ORF type:complete len:116 (-),score=9.90 EC097046.1:153-500(-)